VSRAGIPVPPQFLAEHAERWRDRDAARSYRHRPPYPFETFDLLEGLIVDEPRVVLDIGCGTGAIARPLAARVMRVDAIDMAAEMLDEGRSLPGGDAANIRWLAGTGEEAPLDPPYALVVGGQSLHWMAWGTVLRRFATALTEGGVLAVVTVEDASPPPWADALKEIVRRHSTAKDYVPFDMLPAWENAGLFRTIGSRTTSPVDFVTSVEDFIDGHHAMSSLTRAHIDAAAFDAEVRTLMLAHCPDGDVHRSIRGVVDWGRPLGPPR
jgi:SAM-dependent methyltransferase